MAEKNIREAVIQVKDLYKIYRMGDTKVHALDGLNFEIYRGDTVNVTRSELTTRLIRIHRGGFYSRLQQKMNSHT